MSEGPIHDPLVGSGSVGMAAHIVPLPPSHQQENDDDGKAPSIEDSNTTLSQKLGLCWQDRSFYSIILVTSFIIGCMDLSSLAINYMFKDDLHYTPAQLSLTLGFIVFPWMIKPLWGFISDTYPIYGYRRKPYFIIAGLLAFFSYYSLSLYAHTSEVIILFLCCSALGLCTVSVLSEALIVERVSRVAKFDPNRSKRLSSLLVGLYFGAQAAARVICGGLGGYLLEVTSKRNIFMVTGSFALVIFFISIFIREKRVTREHPGDALTAKQQLFVISQALQLRPIWGPLLFVFVFSMMPSSGTAFFYFLTNDLGMRPSFMGALSVVTGIASIVGLLLYQNFFVNSEYRTLLSWMIVIRFFAAFIPLILVFHLNRELGLDDHYFAIGDTAILSCLSQIASMPLLAIGARYCPANVEATLYSFLMSAMNFGNMLADDIGGAITYFCGVTATDFSRLWLVVCICAAANLIPIFLLQFIDEKHLGLGKHVEIIIPPFDPSSCDQHKRSPSTSNIASSRHDKDDETPDDEKHFTDDEIARDAPAEYRYNASESSVETDVDLDNEEEPLVRHADSRQSQL